MTAIPIHAGLPSGITQHKLFALIKRIARGENRKTKVSNTALRLLEHHVFACRPGDFEMGSICGNWEQAETIAAEIGISTRVFHNAEAELIEHGFIERTYTNQRYG